MPKVICTLPNASASINGVKFSKHDLGVISEDISDAQAEAFLSIPGYEPEEERAPVVVAAPKPAAVAPKAPKKAHEPVAPAEAPAAAQDDPNVF